MIVPFLCERRMWQNLILEGFISTSSPLTPSNPCNFDDLFFFGVKYLNNYNKENEMTISLGCTNMLSFGERLKKIRMHCWTWIYARTPKRHVLKWDWTTCSNFVTFFSAHNCVCVWVGGGLLIWSCNESKKIFIVSIKRDFHTNLKYYEESIYA